MPAGQNVLKKKFFFFLVSQNIGEHKQKMIFKKNYIYMYDFQIKLYFFLLEVCVLLYSPKYFLPKNLMLEIGVEDID